MTCSASYCLETAYGSMDCMYVCMYEYMSGLFYREESMSHLTLIVFTENKLKKQCRKFKTLKQIKNKFRTMLLLLELIKDNQSL
jgi:hypothetical protein